MNDCTYCNPYKSKGVFCAANVIIIPEKQEL